MKKLLLFLICFVHLWSFSQNESFSQKERYTVLYLIPFFSELSDEISISQIKNDYDIYTYSSFQLISFWEGAQIALREFEKQSVKLDIIVKDIVPDDIEKMKLVLDDTALMSRVDLIIGPFYKNVFEIAAQYALTYRIPIVNPLSNNNDYLNVNPFVYKAIPGKNTKPFWIEKKLLSQYDHAKVILYYDNEKSEEVELYKNYFSKKDSSIYTYIPFKQGITNLITALDPHKHNIIIASSQSVSTVISNIRLLVNHEKLPPFTLIMPESFLVDIEGELEDFNKLNMHFFSNYYVNENDEKTLYFITEFIEKFHSPPSVNRFSYQGYDITRYFITCLIHNFDTSKFSYQPTALDFEFETIGEGDGFENRRLRLLQLQDFEIIEVK